jgi:hypothetical protein
MQINPPGIANAIPGITFYRHKIADEGIIGHFQFGYAIMR